VTDLDEMRSECVATDLAVSEGDGQLHRPASEACASAATPDPTFVERGGDIEGNETGPVAWVSGNPDMDEGAALQILWDSSGRVRSNKGQTADARPHPL
jgi:hypothetical protein